MKIVALLSFLHVAASEDFLWATSGGGWRAMAGSMAFSNVFYQAGLFSDDSSSFTGVSSNSGGTWFSTQFFYSQEFFDAMKGSPQEVAYFFTEWMDTYKNLVPQDMLTSHGRHKKCEQVRDSIIDTNFNLAMGEYNRCVAMREQPECSATDASWACYVDNMLRTASADYGDANFADVEMTPGNRLAPLQSTFLAAMIGLSSSALNREGRNECTYLGPSNTRNEEIYNTVLPLPFVVSNDSAEWLGDYLTGSRTYIDVCSAQFDDYEEYYDEGEGSTTISYPVPRRGPDAYDALSDPFGGSPNVVQIAASSSAAGGATSPLTGGLYMQMFNMYLGVSQGTSSAVYNSGVTDWASVCSQWPETEYCEQNDAQFVDGGNVDNPALVSSIAAYQKESGTSTKLKVVLNVHNQGANLDGDFPQFLAYFATDFNIDQCVEPVSCPVAPGGYLILPNDGAYNPIPSPQIFAEEVRDADLRDALQDLDGTQSQYATFELTTIDNPVYGIEGGQKVDLLVFMLNYDVTTFIFTEGQVDEYTPILSDMIVDIASSDDVLEVVQTFFGTDAVDSSESLIAVK